MFLICGLFLRCSWSMLKYPIPKEKRIRLVKLYYEISILPGMPASIMAVAAEGLNYLTRSKKKLTIDDLRLPWKPIYKLLSKELFLSRRKFEIKSVESSLHINWIFHSPFAPREINV